MKPSLISMIRRWSSRRTWLIGLASLCFLLIALGSWVGLRFWQDWNRLGVLEASGGLYFLREVQLPVPGFRQNDERWGMDLLGPTDGTLGAEGCAVSSAAMVLNFYGIETDPQRLNHFLSENNGYTPQGWIYWEAAAELEPGRIRHAYEDQASYRLIDENLRRGNPVIVRLRLPHGGTHFVVIAGKRGWDYLTQDPGAGAGRGLYPLREIGSRIEALRFYERLVGHNAGETE